MQSSLPHAGDVPGNMRQSRKRQPTSAASVPSLQSQQTGAQGHETRTAPKLTEHLADGEVERVMELVIGGERAHRARPWTAGMVPGATRAVEARQAARWRRSSSMAGLHFGGRAPVGLRPRTGQAAHDRGANPPVGRTPGPDRRAANRLHVSAWRQAQREDGERRQQKEEAWRQEGYPALAMGSRGTLQYRCAPPFEAELTGAASPEVKAEARLRERSLTVQARQHARMYAGGGYPIDVEDAGLSMPYALERVISERVAQRVREEVKQATREGKRRERAAQTRARQLAQEKQQLEAEVSQLQQALHQSPMGSRREGLHEPDSPVPSASAGTEAAAAATTVQAQVRGRAVRQHARREASAAATVQAQVRSQAARGHRVHTSKTLSNGALPDTKTNTSGSRTAPPLSSSSQPSDCVIVFGGMDDEQRRELGQRLAAMSGGTLVTPTLLVKHALEPPAAGRLTKFADSLAALSALMRSLPSPYVLCGVPRMPAQLPTLEAAVGTVRVAIAAPGVSNDEAEVKAAMQFGEHFAGRLHQMSSVQEPALLSAIAAMRGTAFVQNEAFMNQPIHATAEHALEAPAAQPPAAQPPAAQPPAAQPPANSVHGAASERDGAAAAETAQSGTVRVRLIVERADAVRATVVITRPAVEALPLLPSPIQGAAGGVGERLARAGYLGAALESMLDAADDKGAPPHEQRENVAPSAAQAADAKAAEIFAARDIDGSGRIEIDELYDILGDLGGELSMLTSPQVCVESKRAVCSTIRAPLAPSR